MTPTLLGRWQIRIFLLATVGLLISFLVGLSIGGKYQVPLLILLYVLLFGLVWDMLYQVITSFRWDRDWPTSFQVAAGIIEGALVWGLVLTKILPGIAEPPPFIVFLIQYGATWLSIFLLTQGPLRIFWVKWRYHGGQWFVSHRAQPGPSVSQQQPVPAPQIAGAYNFQQPVPPPQFARTNNPTPLPAPQISGEYNFQQPVPPPQFARTSNPTPLPAPQISGEYNFQQPVPPPQFARTSNPTPYQGQGDWAGPQPVRTYACACGFAFDPTAANFCPRCGRPKMQQGVS